MTARKLNLPALRITLRHAAPALQVWQRPPLLRQVRLSWPRARPCPVCAAWQPIPVLGPSLRCRCPPGWSTLAAGVFPKDTRFERADEMGRVFVDARVYCSSTCALQTSLDFGIRCTGGEGSGKVREKNGSWGQRGSGEGRGGHDREGEAAERPSPPPPCRMLRRCVRWAGATESARRVLTVFFFIF